MHRELETKYQPSIREKSYMQRDMAVMGRARTEREREKKQQNIP